MREDHITPFQTPFLYPKARGCQPPLRPLKLMLLPTLVLKGHLQTLAPSLLHMEPVFFFVPPAFASIKRAFSQIAAV